VSGKEYRGINVFLLGCQGYESPYWVTFKQAKELGGSVRKGERASPIVFWKWLEPKGTNPETGEKETRRIPLLRYFSAFNVDQCDGVKHRRLVEAIEAQPKVFSPIQRAEALVAGYRSAPSITHGGAKAFDRPADDSVTLPAREAFESPEAYYSVLFHELVHSTGHRSRLARPGVTEPIRFASHDYSAEEFVAEMGASFCRAMVGIDSEDLVTNSAAYLAGWLRALRKDARMLVIAGAQAQKATDWIRGKAAEEAESTELLAA